MEDKERENSNGYLNTLLTIKHCKRCSKCPYRIFAGEKDTIKFGIGNYIADTMIVLPAYDINTEGHIIERLREIYKSITGLELLENVYLTRSFKCYKRSEFNLSFAAFDCCKSHLEYEIRSVNPKKIIVSDRLADEFIDNLCYGKMIVRHSYNVRILFIPNNVYADEFIKSFKEILA